MYILHINEPQSLDHYNIIIAIIYLPLFKLLMPIENKSRLALLNKKARSRKLTHDRKFVLFLVSCFYDRTQHPSFHLSFLVDSVSLLSAL